MAQSPSPTGLPKSLSKSAVSIAALLCLASGTLFANAPPDDVGNDHVTLHVEDTRVHEQDVAVVVVRTYAPRPVGSGQLCLRIRKRSRATRSAIADLELLEVRVFGDHVFSSSTFVPDVDGGEIAVSFSSTDLINRADGPLMAAFLRIGPGLTSGTELDLELDLTNTTLEDGNGQAIAVDPTPGTLEVLAPGAPFSLAVETRNPDPGESPVVLVSTHRGLRLSSGTIRLSVPETLADSEANLVTRFQFGSVSALMTRESATVMRIDFTSPLADFNEVPGAIFEIHYPRTLEMGSYPVAVLSSGTSLLDELSYPLPLTTEGDVLFVAAQTYVASDFETGDLSEWSP